MLNVKKATALKTQASGMLGDAGTLHTHATSLASNALGSSPQDPEALKQKAGANDSTPGTLRYLARELHTHAQALASAVQAARGNDSVSPKKEAKALKEAVGSDEGSGTSPATTLREALHQLHSAAPGAALTQAGKVKEKYEEVKEKFEEVQKQHDLGKYKDHQDKFEAVVAAWKAFNKVYNADLKGLANALATAVGRDDTKELQQALKELSGATEDDKIVENALAVIDKYDAVVRAFKSVTAKEDEYKGALTGGPSGEFATKYNPVKSQFGQLQTAYEKGKCKAISPIHDKEYIR